MESKQVEFPKI